MPPLGFAMIIGLGASCAFMMPVGTPPNAIVYSTGFVKQSEMIRVGKFIDLTCMLNYRDNCFISSGCNL